MPRAIVFSSVVPAGLTRGAPNTSSGRTPTEARTAAAGAASSSSLRVCCIAAIVAGRASVSRHSIAIAVLALMLPAGVRAAPVLERPTTYALGVRLPGVKAHVSVSYRRAGTSRWHAGPPLYRVRRGPAAGGAAGSGWGARGGAGPDPPPR